MNLYYLPLLLLLGVITGIFIAIVLATISITLRIIVVIYKRLTLKPMIYKDRRTKIKATFIPKI